MISIDGAAKKAISVFEGTNVVSAFELGDSYVFAIDYVDAKRPTPGMPLIRVFKDTGEVVAETDRSLLEAAKKVGYER